MEIIVSHGQARVPVTVLRLQGNLDASTYEQFENRARAEITGGAKNIVLDLTDVPYMSSAGLRALTNLFNLLHTEAEQTDLRKAMMAGNAKSPHLKLAGVSKRVADVLSMSGMDMFLDIRKDQKDALAAF
jgi:anti-anti-sigma factor